VILLVRGEDRRYIHCFGANRAFTAADLPREWLATLKVFYLGGLLALPGLRTEELRDVLRFCRAQGVITVVDVVVPKGAEDARQRVLPLLPEIDYILPNDDEAAELTGVGDPLGQVRTLLSAGVGNAIVTRGATGAIAGSRTSNEFWQIDAHEIDPVDPSGAGDAFAAGIVTGVLRGWDMPRMLQYAAALGASATRAVGTTDGVFTSEEAERFIAEHPLDITAVNVQ
jgi:sugar/nucleoside kinase (ribokinase family)